MEYFEVTPDDRALIAIALEVLANNFDDGVYRHTVGCAVRCADGSVFLGVNCASVLGSCAEFIAIGAAITAGQRDFDTIVAVHDHAPNCLLPPCGNCRQMLLEYCPDVKVILNDEAGSMVKVNVRKLLPLAYARIEC